MLSQSIPNGGRNQLREKGYAPIGSQISNLATRLRESGGSSARGTGMMGGSDGAAVAGGPARHVPVLARPALEFLNIRDGGIYIDGTFGAGGYSRAILGAANAQVIGIDRDQSAVANGAGLVEAAGGRLTLIEERFSALDRVAGRVVVDQLKDLALRAKCAVVLSTHDERIFDVASRRLHIEDGRCFEVPIHYH